MFLLDTNVISELRKTASGKCDANVKAWADARSATTHYISAISILEIEIGILSISRRDAAQGAVLRAWMDQRVLPTFDDRIIPVDTAIAQRCARLHVPDPQSDRDALIAATALVHGLTVVTRNTDDFAATGVALVNPWIPAETSP